MPSFLASFELLSELLLVPDSIPQQPEQVLLAFSRPADDDPWNACMDIVEIAKLCIVALSTIELPLSTIARKQGSHRKQTPKLAGVSRDCCFPLTPVTRFVWKAEHRP